MLDSRIDFFECCMVFQQCADSHLYKFKKLLDFLGQFARNLLRGCDFTSSIKRGWSFSRQSR